MNVFPCPLHVRLIRWVIIQLLGRKILFRLCW